MAIETVQTTQSKSPGKQEIKEEVKGQTDDGSRFEVKREVKVEATKPDTATEDPYSRVGRAEAIVQRNVLWALGAGIVPFPIFDFVAVTGVQVKMLKELSDVYNIPFKASLAKKIVYSLISGVGSVGIGTAISASLAKLLPSVGTAVGVVTVPLFAAAFTHAVGRLFVMHFESGGTLLDFDATAMRAHFQQEFEKAKETVSRMRKEKEVSASTP